MANSNDVLVCENFSQQDARKQAEKKTNCRLSLTALMSQKLLQRRMHKILIFMKNLIFTLAFMLIGSFAFASNAKFDFKYETTEKNLTTCVETTDPCAACPDNCCTIQWIDGNGTTRTARSCCGSIVISPAPKKPTKDVSKD
jgi:hypothetical protein